MNAALLLIALATATGDPGEGSQAPNHYTISDYTPTTNHQANEIHYLSDDSVKPVSFANCTSPSCAMAAGAGASCASPSCAATMGHAGIAGNSTGSQLGGFSQTDGSFSDALAACTPSGNAAGCPSACCNPCGGGKCCRDRCCRLGCCRCCMLGCGIWARHGLPSTWHPPGNMLPHLPYCAEPKTYYYFRPYNYQHIAQHQDTAQTWGAARHAPYSNEMFKEVYAEFEVEDARDQEPLEPMPELPDPEEKEMEDDADSAVLPLE